MRRSVDCSIDNITKYYTISGSPCEAEYKELSQHTIGIKFAQIFLQKIYLAKFIWLMGEDNQGAIFLEENKQVSQRTKHIDVKFYCISKLFSSSQTI